MYIPAVFICVAVSVVSVVNGQSLNCNWANSLDCKQYPFGPRCGSDGITYENICYLAKAQCVDRSMRLAANGRCPEKASTIQSNAQTTTPTTPVTTTPTPSVATPVTTTPTPSETTPETTTPTPPVTTPVATPVTTTPTPPVTTPVTTPVPVTQISSDPLHTICDTMSHVHCTNDIEPLCGSDDRTYINTCEFHKEVCVHHGLTVKHLGFC